MAPHYSADKALCIGSLLRSDRRGDERRPPVEECVNTFDT